MMQGVLERRIIIVSDIQGTLLWNIPSQAQLVNLTCIMSVLAVRYLEIITLYRYLASGLTAYIYSKTCKLDLFYASLIVKLKMPN
jgi:hypothetical protein